MKEKIIEWMEKQDYRPQNIEEMATSLNTNPIQLKTYLDELEKEYLIKQTKKHKYALLSFFKQYIGTITVKEKGYGFIRSDAFHEDLYVSKLFLAGSMDEDQVIFTITEQEERFNRQEAIVIKVIKRNLHQVIGQIKQDKKKLKFVPEDEKLDLVFDVKDFSIATTGDIVVFNIEEYVNAKLVKGKITLVLGHMHDIGMDIKSVAYKYGFENLFSEEVLEELKELNSPPVQKPTWDKNIITIDGNDAKDLDDAISIQILGNGHYELGVYIADVSSYVLEGSKIDQEAWKRGTSVYLADRVIPMLPTKLSNELCSLQPNRPKKVIACIMEIDSMGKVIQHQIEEGTIQTKYRMTYDEVNAILMEDDQNISIKYQDMLTELRQMEALALILRNMRIKRGALDFDIPESKIIVDEQGKPTDVVLRTRGTGEKLIEEFMLIANETVATTIEKMELPFIYRVHDEPNNLKLAKFNSIAKASGYHLNIRNNKVRQTALQQLLLNLKNEDQGLSTLLLRMMAKAKYSEQNIGHYGLASLSYTHFTSPIRRYPDLLVHRYLRKYLFEHQVDIKTQEDAFQKITAAAIQSSKKERDAIDCEYEVSDMKKAEYMEDHIGSVWDATITSVTNFGLFAQLPNTIEGLVSIASLEGYFVFHENNMSLVGKNITYHLGDKIRVRVVSANKKTRQIDFEVVRSKQNGKRKQNNRKKQKSQS
ncbi:MAG: ribonuclease R [Bacilli bacterium]|jgi:ribonuclease R|nr:ribonuclease R [Bacilli bacterium]MDY0063823.1 ribonuclease R [Bacilli bacterium]